ncbi:hypothetical protein N9Y00_07990 [Tateyamaria sp.]|nr:hypothetical protein [Tateyamaria sp.]
MMIDVVDVAMMREYSSELRGMSLKEAEQELAQALDTIAEEESWAEALAAFVRNGGELPKDL